MIDLFVELALAAAITGALFVALRRGSGLVAVAGLGLAIIAAVYLGNPIHRVYSFHGFWHHAITYEIANGHLPPHDPLVAGERLLYPWGMHLVAAGLSALLDVTPAVAFALMNGACFAITTFLLWRIARTCRFDRTTAIFASTLPLYGLTPFNYGHLAILIQPVLPVTMEFRGTPPGAQFTHINGGSFGVLFSVLALDSLLGTFAVPEAPPKSRYVLLAVAMAGAAFFYPLHFVGAAAIAGAVIGVSALSGAERHRVVFASAAVLAGILCAAPYLLSLGAGRDPAGAIRVERDVRHLLEEAARYGITVLAAILIMIAQRDRLARFVREQTDVAVVLGTAVATTGFLYVVAHYPQGAEYKLQALSVIALGILVSPMVGSLYDRRPLACFAVVTALFLPLGGDLLVKLHPKWWRITDPFVERGRAIEPADPAERELCTWIRAHTGPEDAFIDSRMTIPVFAERPLYFPIDVRRAGLRGWRPNGWLANPKGILHELEGLPLSLIEARERLVRALLIERARPSDADLATARSQVPAALYVVSREGAATERIATDPRFEPAFANSAASVYRLANGARRADS